MDIWEGFKRNRLIENSRFQSNHILRAFSDMTVDVTSIIQLSILISHNAGGFEPELLLSKHIVK